MNTTQKRESKQQYYSNRYLPFFKENFEQERKQNIERFFTQLKQLLETGDYISINYYCKTEIDKIYQIYGIDKETRLALFQILLKYAVEDKRINFAPTDCIISLMRYSMSIKYFGDSMTINWKFLFELIKSRFFQNNLSNPFSMVQKNYFINIKNLCAFLKRYFEDDSIKEVLQCAKDNISPLDPQYTVFILSTFLKVSKKTHSKYYVELLDDIFEIWQWPQFQQYSQYFLQLISTLSRRRTDLPWEKFYNFLFPLFSRIVLQLAPNLLKYSYKETTFPWLTLPHTHIIISSILVHFIVPSDHKNYEPLWNYIEKLFDYLQVYVHPQNQGSYTFEILYFITSFNQKYIYRNTYEIRLKKQIAREQNNNKSPQDQKQQESGMGSPKLNADKLVENIKDDKSESKFVLSQEEELIEEANEFKDDIELDDEEDSDQEPESEKIGIQSAKSVILDEPCHDRFIKLMMGYLKYIIYLKDNKQGIVCSICKYLTIFRPTKVIPYLLDQIYNMFEKDDISYETIIKILIVIITQILNRKFYKPGLYEIPKIMRKLLVLIQASDFESTCRIWKIYDRIFSFIPLWDENDLQEEFKKLNPDKTPSDLKTILNHDEGIDMMEFYKEYTEISIQAFSKFIELFEYVEMKKPRNEKNFRTNFISVHNKFWNFVFQSSPSIFKQILNLVCDHTTNYIQDKAQKYYSYLLNAVSLRDPKSTYDKILPKIFEKILKKSDTINEDLLQAYKHQPIFYLINAQPNSQEILSYYFENINTLSLTWYLNLIDDLMTFGGIAIKSYSQQLEMIIFLCFLHEETCINQIGAKMLQKILMSLLTIFPKELRCWNENEFPDPNYKFYYYKYIGTFQKDQFQIEWHQPGKEEREYAGSLLKKFYYPIIERFNEYHFKNLQELDLVENFEQIIDQLHLQNENANNRQVKLELLKSLCIIEQVLAAIQMRCRLVNIKDEMYTKFADNFLFEEFDNINPQLMEFIQKCTQFILQKQIAQDVNIVFTLISIIQILIGNDEMNNKMLHLQKWLQTHTNIYKNPYYRWQYTPRFINITACNLEFLKRIYSYSYTVIFSKDYIPLIKILYVWLFHPYDSVQLHTESQISKLIFYSEQPLDQLQQFLNQFLKIIGCKLNFNGKNQLQLMIDQNPKNQTQFESYLSKLIICFKLVLRISNQYRINGFDINTIQQIIDLVMTYERISNTQIQKRLLDIILNVFYILHMQVMHLDEMESSINNLQDEQKVPGEQEEKLLLKKIQKATDFLDNLHIKQKDKAYIESENKRLEEMKNTAIQILQDEKVHWRKKSIYGVILILILSRNKCTQAELDQVMKIYVDMMISDDYFLRQLGRAIVFRMMRSKKQTLKSVKIEKIPESEKPPKTTLDDLFKNHFGREQDYLNQSSSYIGFMTYATHNIIKNYKLGTVLDDYLQQRMNDPTFCQKLLQLLQNDINSARENIQIQTMIGSNNPSNDYSLMVNSLYNIDIKKDNMIKKSFYDSDFNSRFFKKIFSLYGQSFYTNTISLIQEFSKDINKKENQTIMGPYLTGLVKSTYTLHNFTNVKEIQDFAQSYILKCFYNVSKDLFQTWIGYIIGILSSNSHIKLRPFINLIVEQKFEQQENNPKFVRQIWLLRYLVKFYGYHLKDLSDSLLDRYKDALCQDSKQILEFQKLVLDIIYFIENCPLNLQYIREQNLVDDLDKQIKQDSMIIEDSHFTIIKKNQRLKNIFDTVSEMSMGKPSLYRKNYINLAWKFINVSSTFKINETFYWYLENIFKYCIEFKEEDLEDEKNIQDSQTYYLLAHLNFKQEILPTILKQIQTNLKNPLWRCRLRSLELYKYFLLANFYSFIDYDFSQPVEHLFLDEQKIVNQNTLFHLSNLFRMMSKEQVQKQVQKYQQMVKQDDNNQKIVGVNGLMSMLLAFPFDAFDWTEQSIQIIMKNKKLTKETFSQLKDFASKFLKSAYNNQLGNPELLSENTIQKLREIANPYNYFA